MGFYKMEARAKINLTLDVLGRRPDGYHEVEMIMQTVELSDVVSFQQAPEGVAVTTDHPLLAGGESNIAHKAARLLMERYGVNKGINIHINKRIPVAAGLAGGSTDAAAVLLGLNKIWSLGLSVAELTDLGAQIGSDVPFCIIGGTALAQGRGEILTALPGVPEMWLVLVKPALEVSTAEVYGNYNAAKVERHPATQEAVRAIYDRNMEGLLKNLANVLESVTLSRYPEVSLVKETMISVGISQVLMSGSGPTVFGVVGSQAEALQRADVLRQRLPGMFITVTTTSPVRQQEFAGSE